MRVSALLVVLLVSGCATMDAPPPANRHWQMTAKLSLSYEGETRLVTMDWRQVGDNSEISLKGPFGTGRVLVSVSPDDIWLDTGDDRRRFSPEQPMTIDDRSLYLPWRLLSYWVRGISGPSGIPIPDTYEQEEWQIRVIRRADFGPELMAFKHPDMALRLRVQSLTGNI